MRPDRIRDQGLAELGVQERLRRISYNPYGAVRPFEEREELLAEYKAELKKLRNRTALECHPDRTADLPEEEQKKRAERMVRINRVVDYVGTLRSRPPAPPMQPMRVVVVQTNGPVSWGSSTTSTASSGTTFSWTAGFPYRNGV